jgi:hypothetical protein
MPQFPRLNLLIYVEKSPKSRFYSEVHAGITLLLLNKNNIHEINIDIISIYN